MEYLIPVIALLVVLLCLCIALKRELSKPRRDRADTSSADVIIKPSRDSTSENKHTDRTALVVLLLLVVILVGCIGGIAGWITSPIETTEPESTTDDSIDLSGYDQGRKDGYDEGYAAGYNAGYEIGYSDGNTAGYHTGYDAGFDMGKAQSDFVATRPTPTPRPSPAPPLDWDAIYERMRSNN